MYKNYSGGLIQKISISPMYLLYWSNHCLQFYNSLSSSKTLFWDATGGIIRKTDNGKQFLYYELALCHPVQGKMGIPITSMVTEDQSLPVVLDWIRNFRHAEKKIWLFKDC
jgi:hypothetical protein